MTQISHNVLLQFRNLLMAKPSLNEQQIAQIIGISTNQVKEILREEFSFNFKFKAMKDYENLGFEVIDVFVFLKQVSNKKYIQYLVANHPYIFYYSELLGPNYGYHIQFHFPIGYCQKILELFSIMRAYGYIDQFSIYQFDYVNTNSSFLDSLHYDVSTFWTSNVVIGKYVKNDPPYLRDWVKFSDCAILNELQLNYYQTYHQIKQALWKKYHYQISEATISRRIQRIKKELVKQVNIYPKNRKKVNTYNNLLILGHGHPQQVKELFFRFQQYPPPSLYLIRVKKYTFYIFIELKSSQMFDFIAGFHQFPNYSIYYVFTNRFYTIDVESFDRKNHRWNISDDHVIDKWINGMLEL